MATVPGILYLAGYQGQGVQPPLRTGDPDLQLALFNKPELQDFVPGGSASPASPAFYPFYDGSASATHYTSNAAGSNTITASGSPGWTTNQWANRRVTVLKPYLDIPTFPLVPWLHFLISGNSTNQLTIAGNWGLTLPSAHTFRIGTGRFVVYHPAPGTVGFTLSPANSITQSLGGAWAQGGVGCGMDVGFMRELLLRVYPTSPYFHFVKFVDTTGLASGWTSGGSSRTFADAELNRVATAASERGNTIDWKLVIIDLSQEDMRQAGASLVNYKSNLTALVAWLRTRLNAPGLMVQLVSPSPLQLSLTKPGAAIFIRGEHDQFVRDNPSAAILDMANEPMGQPWQHPSDLAADLHFYEALAYPRQGVASVKLFARQLAGASTSGAVGKGMPIVVLLGDSIAAGQVDPTWTVLLSSPTLSGPRAATQRVYNRVAGALQPYNPSANGNRSGDVNLLAGPEISITAELASLFPNGFVLVKRGASSSALRSTIAPYSGGQGGRWEQGANEHFPELVADVRAAQALVFAEGYYPELVGAFVVLGTNDGLQAGDGAEFASRLPLFVQNLRTALTTRPKGDPFPIAWRRPQIGTNGSLPAEIDAIRAALASYAAKDSRFHVVDVDDLERRDGIHETPAAAVTNGQRMVKAIAGELVA